MYTRRSSRNRSEEHLRRKQRSRRYWEIDRRGLIDCSFLWTLEDSDGQSSWNEDSIDRCENKEIGGRRSLTGANVLAVSWIKSLSKGGLFGAEWRKAKQRKRTWLDNERGTWLWKNRRSGFWKQKKLRRRRWLHWSGNAIRKWAFQKGCDLISRERA